MQPRRITERIEGWGQYEGRIGFRMIFTDGSSEAFLFDLDTAYALCTQGKTLVELLRQAQHAAQPLHSGVGIGDAVKMRLLKAGE
jgi:hypothetical protein